MGVQLLCVVIMLGSEAADTIWRRFGLMFLAVGFKSQSSELRKMGMKVWLQVRDLGFRAYEEWSCFFRDLLALGGPEDIEN